MTDPGRTTPSPTPSASSRPKLFWLISLLVVLGVNQLARDFRAARRRSIRQKLRLFAREARHHPGNVIFRGIVGAAAAFMVGLFGAFVVFLADKSTITLNQYGFSFLWGPIWGPSPCFKPGLTCGVYGALPYIEGTVYTSLIALAIAVPISLGIAIFVSERAPEWLRIPLSSIVDLLAAVPSVVFGLWGLWVLVPFMSKTGEPFLGSLTKNTLIVQQPYTGYGLLTSGIILAIMIIPTIAALSREALLSVPRAQREAALALGATRWETTRVGVLKYARSGIVGGIVLGLGRAVGETMAVVMTIGQALTLPTCLTCGASTMASIIASAWPDQVNTYEDPSALIEIGLVLLFITLLINIAARTLIWGLTAPGQGRDEDPTKTLRGRIRQRLGLKSRPSRSLEPSIEPPDGRSARVAGSLPAAISTGTGGEVWGQRDRLRRWKNWTMDGLTLACVGIALVPLGDILWTCFYNGSKVVSLNFLVGAEATSSFCNFGNPGCPIGGIGPALQGTFILMGMAAAWSIPVSLLAAIFLSEYGKGGAGRAISFMMDVLSGVPSIVVGVFVFAFFFVYDINFTSSTYSQSFALGIIMLPLVTRTAEEGLKSVPHTLREAAWGLGIPQHKTVTRVVLRNGLGPMVTGALLAAARAGGETAPLLFLGFSRLSIFTNCPTSSVLSCFDHAAGATGPLIYTDYQGPGTNVIAVAWGAALVFVLMMLGLSLAARLALRGRVGGTPAN